MALINDDNAENNSSQVYIYIYEIWDKMKAMSAAGVDHTYSGGVS